MQVITCLFFHIKTSKKFSLYSKNIKKNTKSISGKCFDCVLKKQQRETDSTCH